jgi:hypothetical protein
MKDAFEAIAYSNNATHQALAILTKCLLNNGALRPGQFSSALKAALNEPDAQWDRLDHTFLQLLANLIGEAESSGRPTSS